MMCLPEAGKSLIKEYQKMKKLALAITILSILAVFISGISAYAGGTLTGKVIETMNSGGYTYAQIENSGTQTWVAVPETSIKKGQTVSFKPGMVMPSFKSKTLNRTFENIVFSEGVIK